MLPVIIALGLLSLAPDRPAEQRVVADLNWHREASAISPLRLDAQLTAFAHERADDMIRRHYFDHTNPEGETVIATLRDRAYHFAYAAENISLASDEEQAEEGLWASQPHRQNILGSHYRRVGIAVVSAASGCYLIQIFSD